MSASLKSNALRLAAPADRAPPFMAFAADDATRAAMIEAAERTGFEVTAVVNGDPMLAAASLKEIPTPEVLVVDLDGELPARAAVERLAEVCDPGTHVVFVGSLNDVTFYRELKSAGVGDYLVKPITATSLADALRKPEPMVAEVQQVSTSEGLRIGVIGARGGVGTTSIATSIAWLLAEERDIHTALVDFDVSFGNVALALDLEPSRGLADAMENPARVDDLFIERATLMLTEKLGVLASEADPANCRTAPDAAAGLCAHLARSFGVVVFDLPRSFAGDAAFIAGLDHIVLVSEPTLTGLRDIVRLRTMLLGQGISEAAIHVVINRIGMLAKGELDAKTIAAGGQLDGALRLPFDAKAAARAMTEAKPLAVAAGRTKLGKALRLLAADVAPLVVEAPARGLARLFRRRA